MQIIIPILIALAIFLFWRLIPTFLRLVGRFLSRTVALTYRHHLDLEERMVVAFAQPLAFLMVVLGIWIILQLIDLSENLLKIADQAIAGLILATLFWAVYRAMNIVFSILMERSRRSDTDTRLSETLLQFGERATKTVIIAVAFFSVMEQIGYSLTGLVAGLGIGGLAVALAAQETLSNLVGYFAILGDSPFRVGDFIMLGDFEGTVEDIGFRTTQVRTPDGAIIIVPNRIMASDVLTNWSRAAHGPQRGRARVSFTIGVTYATTADQMEQVVPAIREMLIAHERVIDESVVVHFTAFNDSSLDILVVCVVRKSNWQELQAAREEINLQIMRILEKQKIDIAFPTRTIVLEQEAK